MRPLLLGRAAAMAAATFALSLAVATPALATATTGITLNPGQKGKTAAAFESSCDQIPGGSVAAGKDGWVFILPGNSGTLVSLRLTFKHDGVTETVDIPGTSYPNGIATNGSDKAWVVLPAGWTLVDGTGKASGGKETFNVTHTCLAGGGSGQGQPGTPASPTPPKTATPAPGGSPSLPVTGAQVGGAVVVGLGLIAGGIGLLALRRRRGNVTFEA